MPYPKLKQEHYKNLGGINLYHSAYTTEETQFLDLRNYTFERPGSLTQRPGQEYWATLNAQSFLIKPSSFFQYTKSDGSSYLLFDSSRFLAAYAPNITTFNSLTITSQTFSPIDFDTSNDVAYFANGEFFGRYDGTIPLSFFKPLTNALVGTNGLTFNTSLTAGPTAVIASGTFVASYEYLRQGLTTIQTLLYGFTFYSGIKNGATILSQAAVATSVGSTITSRGRWQLYGLTIPPANGITSILPALYTPAQSYLYGVASTLYPVSVGGVTVFATEFDHLTTSNNYEFLLEQPFFQAPKLLATYNNILFVAGFVSTIGSAVFFSEPGEPELIEADNFFEVRSGNPDAITCLIVFQDALIIFKENSMHELRGDNQENFSLRLISAEYGCVNNTAAVVFENRLWFVGRDGIYQYDGANIQIKSLEIGPLLKLVNNTQIRAIHVKEKQQVWFSAENVCFVWDYFNEAWFIYDRLPIDSTTGAAVIRYSATLSDVSYFRSGTTGFALARFGNSLSTDFGQAITLYAQSRFHQRLGQTTEEMWRRLYFNIDAPSSTLSVTFSFIPNYKLGVSLVRGMALGDFQERLDFGVVGKGLSVAWVIQSTQKVVVNGYALESRYLRSV